MNGVRGTAIGLPYNTAEERRAEAMRLIHAALEAVDAERATHAAIRGMELDIPSSGVTVFGCGKAALGMTRAVLRDLPVRTGRVHCLKGGALGSVDLIQSGHPLPAQDAAEQGKKTLELAKSLGRDDLALCLVSGGGSAMLECPRPGISISDIRHRTSALLLGGADIRVVNRARTAWSLIKGGGLARAVRPARLVTLVIHDTPGLPAETVASGPSLPSDVLEVCADNDTAVRAVLQQAPYLRRLDEVFCGEARDVGQRLAVMEPGFVVGGESTVTVAGSGRGGRNQELVLGALTSFQNGLLLAFGTDGVDGNSSSAGAFIDRLVIEQGIDPSSYLEENDSETYFKSVDSSIVLGPTGTNVADLVISLP